MVRQVREEVMEVGKRWQVVGLQYLQSCGMQ